MLLILDDLVEECVLRVGLLFVVEECSEIVSVFDLLWVLLLVDCSVSVIEIVLCILELLTVVGVAVGVESVAACGLLLDDVLECLVVDLVCVPEVIESVTLPEFAVLDASVSVLL